MYSFITVPAELFNTNSDAVDVYLILDGSGNVVARCHAASTAGTLVAALNS